MLIAITDKYGYVNDCAIVVIANIIGVKPIKVLSVASAHSYIRLQPVGDNVFYLCKCFNCILSGADKL